MGKFGSFFTRTLSCSFCGKSEHKVRKLIAGPAVFICDACVGICVKVLDEDDRASTPPAPVSRRAVDRVRAWFAGLKRSDGNSHLAGVLR